MEYFNDYAKLMEDTMKHYISGMTVNTFGESTNQSIVFIQGFPYDQSIWFNLAEKFSDFYCITYDLRGLGESYVGDGQYTMEFYVEDLFSIMDQLGFEKPILCGLSKGGYIALRAVERNQKSFSGLILCNTNSESEDDQCKLTRSDSINLINIEGLGKYIDKFLKKCFSDYTLKNNESLFISTYNNALKHYPLGVKGSILAMMTRTSTTSYLPKIKIPSLIISGEDDKLIDTGSVKKLAEKMVGSEFVIIKNAGHTLPLEQPEEFYNVVSNYLLRKFFKKK
ncbi:MAG: alpha/beta hydrolase [Ignavibacteria bacterium]|nr:alpha/beta hydrolase [Ignavibacteria bacterium]